VCVQYNVVNLNVVLCNSYPTIGGFGGSGLGGGYGLGGLGGYPAAGGLYAGYPLGGYGSYGQG